MNSWTCMKNENFKKCDVGEKKGINSRVSQGMCMVHILDTLLNIATKSMPKMPRLIFHSFSPSCPFLKHYIKKKTILTNTNENIIVFLFAP
jgi:hypothetical protein